MIDVGANRGQYYDFLRRAAAFAGFDRAAGGPPWHNAECALGKREGTARFKMMAETQFSSLLEPPTSTVGDTALPARGTHP